MRVLLSTWGSRGDTEPLAALALSMRELGAEVRVCAPPDEEFTALFARAGATVDPARAVDAVGGDPTEGTVGGRRIPARG